MMSAASTSSPSTRSFETSSITNSKSACPRRAARLSTLPVERLSTTVTRCPSATRRSARCEPMNPAPPVIRNLGMGLNHDFSVPLCLCGKLAFHCLPDKPEIQLQMRLGTPVAAEGLVTFLAELAPKRRLLSECGHCLPQLLARAIHKPTPAIVNHFRQRAQIIYDHRRFSGKRLDDDDAEGLVGDGGDD